MSAIGFPMQFWFLRSACDLIGRMLAVDPGSRMTSEECEVHPWVAQLDSSASRLSFNMDSQSSPSAYSRAAQEVSPSRTKPGNRREKGAEDLIVSSANIQRSGYADIQEWEIREMNPAIVELQAEIRGAVVRIGLGQAKQCLLDEKERLIDLQSIVRGTRARQTTKCQQRISQLRKTTFHHLCFNLTMLFQLIEPALEEGRTRVRWRCVSIYPSSNSLAIPSSFPHPALSRQPPYVGLMTKTIQQFHRFARHGDLNQWDLTILMQFLLP